jgi:hypothetical protein
MNPLNLYSAPLLAIFANLVTGTVLLRRGVNPWRVAVLVLLALGLLAVWWLVRPVQTPHADLAALEDQIGAGTPVLLELQSPY